MTLEELLAPNAGVDSARARLAQQSPMAQSSLPYIQQLAKIFGDRPAPSGSSGGGINAAVPTGGSGLLELIYGGNEFNPTSDDSTHPTHLHAAMAKGIVPLGRKLQRLGFDVGEHPKFGGVAPVHTENSHHYSKDAIDVNYRGDGRWKNEAQALSWLEKWLERNY